MSQPEVDECLEKFVTHFVELFESYFSECHRRLIGRSPKDGRLARLLGEILGISKGGGEVLEGVPKASTLILLDLIVKGIKMKSLNDDWRKLTELARNAKLLEYGKDDQLRDILIKGAGLIFANFEAQFVNVTADAGWEYAIRKIAIDAVHRVISYLRKYNMGTDEKAIVKVMSQGVILGKSKRYSSPLGIPHYHLGHSINLLVGDEATPIKTSDMFENLGVKAKDKYYVPKVTHRGISRDRGVWFRLAFEWESIESDSAKQSSDAPRDEYKYELNGLVPQAKLESMKKLIDEERSGITKKELDEIKKNAKIYADETKEILERNHDVVKKTLDELKKEIEGLKEVSAKTQKIAEETLNKADAIEGIVLEIRDGKKQVEKPIRFNVKPPVTSFTGRKQELDNLHELVFRETKASYLTRITVIHGLGGIGKTQLARQYIYERRDKFFDVVWLDADTAGSLNGAFVELAKDHCEIPTVDINDKNVAIPAIVKKVYDYFRDRKSSRDTLVIFDNAEETYDFGDFLPVYDSSKTHDEPRGEIRILITSRVWEWANRYHDIKKLPLQGFNCDDAFDFVYNSLTVEQSDNQGIIKDPESKEPPQQNINPEGASAPNSQNIERDKEIKKLVETLQCFPLALEQAVAYIIDERVTDLDYSVSKYLEHYKEKTKELLDNEAFKNFSQEYEKPTFATWNLTMAKISELGFHGKLAIEIINIIAFIAPDKIHREIFFRMQDVKDDDVKKAVRLIVKYSMVNAEVGQEVLNVHRLVQEVIRLQLQEKGDYENYLNAAMVLFSSWGNSEELILSPVEEFSRVIQFIHPHLEALVVHMAAKNQQGGLRNIFDIYMNIFDVLEGVHPFTYDLQRVCLEWSLEILKGEDSLREAEILGKLGAVLMELGALSEAICSHEQALGIYTKLKDQIMMAVSHSKIADIYRVSYELRKSKEHYYDALRILDDHKKGNDPHVVMNKLSICLNLRLVDDSKATTDLLKLNLGYWEHYTGETKYLLPEKILELGEAYAKIGKEEKASEYFKKSLKMCMLYTNDGLFYARMMRMINYSNVRSNLGIDLEAHLEKSLTIMSETQGPQHVETLKFMIDFAKFRLMMGNSENGWQLMEEALDIARRNNYILSGLLVHLGFMYNQTGNHGKALELTNEGLSILESYHGESSIQLFAALEVLALIHENIGNAQQQRDIYDRLLLITQERWGVGDYRLAWVRVRYGKVLEHLGDMDKSRELIQKGMPVLISLFGTEEQAEVAASKSLTNFI